MKKLLLILLIISLSLFCLLMATEKHTFNLRNYVDSFEKHNTYEVTGKDYYELVDITKDLFTYLKGDAGDEILEANFNEREILHMRDVQVLFEYGFILKYVSIIVTLATVVYFAFIGEIKLVANWIFKGLFANWVILGLLGIMIFFDFNKYFTYFHYIFFTNDLWLLNPNTDLLIQMLPEGFFISIATRIAVSFFIFLATIQGIAYGVLKKGREDNEKWSKIFKRRT